MDPAAPPAQGEHLLRRQLGREPGHEVPVCADPARPLGPGSYTFAWKTAGSDVHALTGDLKFVVAATAEPLR